MIATEQRMRSARTTSRTLTLLTTLFTVATLGACGDKGQAAEMRESVHVVLDTLRGPPSARALAQTARFTEAGIAFDYPQPLRKAYEQVDGDDVWTLGYGLYEVEVWVSADPVDAHGYLEAIAGQLANTENAQILAPVADGRALKACGADVVTATMRIAFAGIDGSYEVLALPAAHGEGSRVLMLTDLRQGKEEDSPVAKATGPMVLSTLTCQDKTEEAAP